MNVHVLEGESVFGANQRWQRTDLNGSVLCSLQFEEGDRHRTKEFAYRFVCLQVRRPQSCDVIGTSLQIELKAAIRLLDEHLTVR